MQFCALPWQGGSLFVGAYGFFQRWEYSRSDTSNRAVAYWLTPAPSVGARVYDEPAIFPVLALHIGYEFDL